MGNSEDTRYGKDHLHPSSKSKIRRNADHPILPGNDLGTEECFLTETETAKIVKEDTAVPDSSGTDGHRSLGED